MLFQHIQPHHQVHALQQVDYLDAREHAEFAALYFCAGPRFLQRHNRNIFFSTCHAIAKNEHAVRRRISKYA